MPEPDTQATEQEAPAEEVDTAESQPSEASEAINESPEATQEETETEQEAVSEETEVKAEDTEEKLYAGKYKTVEDLEKAYKNAESKIGKETSEKAQLTKALNESFDSEDPTTIADTEKLKRDTAVLKFIFQYPDADAETMQTVLTEDPMINNISGHEAKLEYAYLKSQSMLSQETIETAKKEATKATKSKIAEKEAATVESARKAEPVDEGADLMQQATAGTPDERKAARLAIIRKNLVNL